MGTTIKVKFSGGVLKPLEEVGLDEGQEVTITIVGLSSAGDTAWLDRTAGGWKDLIDLERLKREICESRLVTTRPEPRL